MQGNRPVIGIAVEQDGDYARLKHPYYLAVLRAGGTPVLLPPCEDPGFFVAVIDGLLLPGGGDVDPSYYGEKPFPGVKIVPRARSDFEMRLLRDMIEVGTPVLGICYGMQLINVALGGSLYQDVQSQLSTPVDHGKGNHKVVGNGRWLKGEFMVNTSHHQAVKEEGKGLEVVARAEDRLVEAICSPEHPFLLGVQWHPERSEDDVSLEIFRSFVEASRGRK